MKKCPYCNTVQISVRHSYKCCKTNNKSNRKIKLEYLIFNYGKNDIKSILSKYVSGYSLPKLSKEYLIDYNNILFLIDYFNIDKRNLSTARKNAQNEIEKTCVIKYGKKNPLSKGTLPYKKRNETVYKRYGVYNVFQIPEIIRKINSDEYWISKYGMTKSEYVSKTNKERWKNKSDDEKKNFMKKTLWSKLSPISNLEKRLANIFIDNSISFTIQFFIGKFSYDFLIEKKYVLEVQGNFWHANPKIYKSNDVFNFPNNQKISASDIWLKDKIKKKKCEEKGLKYYCIWEDEINNNDDYEVFEIIKNMIWK